MITRYFNFTNDHRHPETDEKMVDYVVKVVAPSQGLCIAAMRAKYDFHWKRPLQTYQKQYYPKGVYETILVSLDRYEGNVQEDGSPYKIETVQPST